MGEVEPISVLWDVHYLFRKPNSSSEFGQDALCNAESSLVLYVIHTSFKIRWRAFRANKYNVFRVWWSSVYSDETKLYSCCFWPQLGYKINQGCTDSDFWGHADGEYLNWPHSICIILSYTLTVGWTSDLDCGTSNDNGVLSVPLAFSTSWTLRSISLHFITTNALMAISKSR